MNATTILKLALDRERELNNKLGKIIHGQRGRIRGLQEEVERIRYYGLRSENLEHQLSLEMTRRGIAERDLRNVSQRIRTQLQEEFRTELARLDNYKARAVAYESIAHDREQTNKRLVKELKDALTELRRLQAVSAATPTQPKPSRWQRFWNSFGERKTW